MAGSGCKFGWKRKVGSLVSQSKSKAFGEDSRNDDLDDDVDWLSATKSRKVICLEDAVAKSRRLKDEGTLLAESERYWEAIKKWDEALHYMPSDAQLYEMKAQVLMILCEVFPAVHAATRAVDLRPNWWAGLQTLGRTQLNLGDVKQAVRSFSKAVHVNPAESELWKEDLLWACSLLERKTRAEEAERAAGCETAGVTVTEIENSDSDLELTEIVGSEGAPDAAQFGGGERELKPQGDTTLQCYSSGDRESAQSRTEAKIPVRTVPPNYVLMRD